MIKRFFSFLLSCAVLFLTVVSPYSPLFQTVQAFPGDEHNTTLSDGTSYTYVEEPGFKYYDPDDPNAYLLFSSSTIQNWAPQAADSDNVANDYWYFTGNRVSPTGITQGYAASMQYKAQNSNNYSALKYYVCKTSADPYANGDLATADQAAVLSDWGVTRMVGFQMVDSTPGDGSFPGVGGDTYDYYFNIQISFGRYIDLTKFTHLYVDFWVSGDYTIRTPGRLNFALCDQSKSANDGFEYNVDMSKLRLDNESPRTGHNYRFDLRQYTTGGSGLDINMNAINGIAIRYMTPVSDKTQYNSGKTPRIYLGKIVAYCETDNLHPATHWYAGSTEHTTSNALEPEQSSLAVFTGAKNWNSGVTVFVPMWMGAGFRIMGLPWGDRSTTTLDYYYNALDLQQWRWRRYNVTSAAYTSQLVGFPASPLNGSGGNIAMQVNRYESRWLSDTTHGSFKVS